MGEAQRCIVRPVRKIQTSHKPYQVTPRVSVNHVLRDCSREGVPHVDKCV